jgi:hypothetical protein
VPLAAAGLHVAGAGPPRCGKYIKSEVLSSLAQRNLKVVQRQFATAIASGCLVLVNPAGAGTVPCAVT